eukprot:3405424-Alexandrium_andersonii.AAC.1
MCIRDSTWLSRSRAVARSCELKADLPSNLATANPSVSVRVWAALAKASAPLGTPTANWCGLKAWAM